MPRVTQYAVQHAVATDLIRQALAAASFGDQFVKSRIKPFCFRQPSLTARRVNQFFEFVFQCSQFERCDSATGVPSGFAFKNPAKMTDVKNLSRSKRPNNGATIRLQFHQPKPRQFDQGFANRSHADTVSFREKLHAQSLACLKLTLKKVAKHFRDNIVTPLPVIHEFLSLSNENTQPSAIVYI
jgi:hypothetical protein